MNEGIYSKKLIVPPDYCDAAANLSPAGIFTVFQAIAAEHAELLDIGASAILKRGTFWVTVHTRVDFLAPVRMMKEITAKTWAEKCLPENMKCFRDYELFCGETLIAAGKTQWAILGKDKKALRFDQSGFPGDYVYPERFSIPGEMAWMSDDFEESDCSEEYIVRATDIDFGQHMNNIAYVRKFLDQFSSKEIQVNKIRSMEVHYGTPCYEQELLRIYCKREAKLCRMAVKKADGKTAAMAVLTFRE